MENKKFRKLAFAHDYSGACRPGGEAMLSSGQSTFSVGIFQWVPKPDKVGDKKSAVKVRVKGWFSDPNAVYRLAEMICDELDAGKYHGTKNVMVFKKAQE